MLIAISVIGHILWDLTSASLADINQEQFNILPAIVKESMAARVGGKNAYVSPHDRDYGLLRMYEVITRFRCMPYESYVYRNIDDALNWLLCPLSRPDPSGESIHEKKMKSFSSRKEGQISCEA